MLPSDDQLRLAYAERRDRRNPVDRAACPAAETLLAIVERTGSEEVRLEALDHIMACEWCRRDLDLVRASAVAAGGVPRARSWVRSPAIPLLAVAAVLMVVAGVRAYVAGNDAEAGPRLRGGSAVVTYPARPIPNVGAGLAWRPVEGAVSYRVEVIDEAGQALVDSTMRDTSLVIPDPRLQGRRGVVWSVSAMLGDGTTVSSQPVPLISPAR